MNESKHPNKLSLNVTGIIKVVVLDWIRVNIAAECTFKYSQKTKCTLTHHQSSANINVSLTKSDTLISIFLFWWWKCTYLWPTTFLCCLFCFTSDPPLCSAIIMWMRTEKNSWIPPPNPISFSNTETKIQLWGTFQHCVSQFRSRQLDKQEMWHDAWCVVYLSPRSDVHS